MCPMGLTIGWARTEPELNKSDKGEMGVFHKPLKQGSIIHTWMASIQNE